MYRQQEVKGSLQASEKRNAVVCCVLRATLDWRDSSLSMPASVCRWPHSNILKYYREFKALKRHDDSKIHAALVIVCLWGDRNIPESAVYCLSAERRGFILVTTVPLHNKIHFPWFKVRQSPNYNVTRSKKKKKITGNIESNEQTAKESTPQRPVCNVNMK